MGTSLPLVTEWGKEGRGRGGDEGDERKNRAIKRGDRGGEKQKEGVRKGLKRICEVKR